MNFILTISNFIFPLITFPYASRILGASGVGTVTFATSIIAYFSMIGMMGIPTYGIRACAKIRDDREALNKTVQEIVVLNSIVMSLALILFFMVVFAVPKLANEKLLYLYMSSTLLFNVLGVDWLYKALEKYSYITLRSLIFKILSLILLYLAVKTSDDYIAYGVITVFAGVGSNFLNFINLRRIIDLKPAKELNVKQHIRPTLTFFLLTVSTTIYTNVDTTMIGFLKGDIEVGYYSAAVKVKQILVSVVTSLGTVLLPRLSFYYEQKRFQEFKVLVQKAFTFVLILSLPLTVYFILMAKESILFLSGNIFLQAVLPMQLILPTVIFIGLSNLMGIQILVPMNKERLVVQSTIVGAGLDFLINCFTIPLFGAAGAAVAGSLAECSVVLVQIYFLRDLIIPMFKSIPLWKILMSIIISILITTGVKMNLSVGTFLTLVCTAAVFFTTYGSMLLVLKEKFVLSISHAVLEKLK
nr:flippase [Streptococcus himalayensis]